MISGQNHGCKEIYKQSLVRSTTTGGCEVTQVNIKESKGLKKEMEKLK